MALPVTLPEFYATYVGLELGVVAAVFMIVRLIDIVFDPFIGWAMDRTKTRFGRYRPWMAISTPILMLSALMMFVVVQPGAGAAYLFGWLLVLYLGFSIGTLGQLGWAAVLAPEYDQRSRVYGWWQVFNIIGVILILILPTVVVQRAIGDYADGVRIMGWAILIALPVTIALAMFVVPEPVNAGAAPHGGPGPTSRCSSARRCASCCSPTCCSASRPASPARCCSSSSARSRATTTTEASLFMLLYFVAGLVGAPFWAWLATRVGKDRALAIASLIFAVLYIGATLVPGGNFALTAVGHVHRRPALCRRPVPAAGHDGRRRRRGAAGDRRGPDRPDVLDPVGHDQDRPRRRP